jgi:hypothetical protein
MAWWRWHGNIKLVTTMTWWRTMTVMTMDGGGSGIAHLVVTPPPSRKRTFFFS